MRKEDIGKIDGGRCLTQLAARRKVGKHIIDKVLELRSSSTVQILDANICRAIKTIY